MAMQLDVVLERSVGNLSMEMKGGMSSSDVRVLLLLATMTKGETLSVHVSHRKLCEYAGMCLTTLLRSLNRLSGIGAIAITKNYREDNGRIPNTYSLAPLVGGVDNGR